MAEDIGDKIRRIIVEQLGVEGQELVPETSITDDLGADSLDLVELVMALEETFDIEVPDERVEHIRTLGDVERFISQELAAAR